MIKRHFSILFVLFLQTGILYSDTSSLDLEKDLSPFILEVKRIQIDQLPHAFNPSVVRYKGRLLLAFRILREPEKGIGLFSSGFSEIGLQWLDDDFQPTGDPFILDLTSKEGSISRAEDPRLFLQDNRLYLIYSDNQEEYLTEGGFRVYMGELIETCEGFLLFDKVCFDEFPGECSKRREKNWIPFDYKGLLLFAYMINPHKVFFPLLSSGRLHEIADTSFDTNWRWGELRGGTPALLIGDKYLAFFHSSIEMRSLHSHGKTSLHYFIGAYTFSSAPPFEVLSMSEKPIIGPGFYSGIEYPPYWKPVNVVFPCGFLIENDLIYLVYGRQDHEMYVAKIDKRKLLESLSR